MFTLFKNLSAQLKQYLVITANYWAFTLTDGALRMLVVLYFYQLGYSALEVVSYSMGHVCPGFVGDCQRSQ